MLRATNLNDQNLEVHNKSELNCKELGWNSNLIQSKLRFGSSVKFRFEMFIREKNLEFPY